MGVTGIPAHPHPQLGSAVDEERDEFLGFSEAVRGLICLPSVYSFTPHLFAGHVLCARPRAGWRGHGGEEDIRGSAGRGDYSVFPTHKQGASDPDFGIR